ncbi:DNA-directed RNA polymerase III subunit RPC6-like [Daphnia carinata]|uniref:DNA-directed RNA polymerase III subunit RPC6-like n=1 Tax=Daphnia carinata TaxID=120202 RepID=UPI002580927B|nr:DNA-directed RNA polymerase III subunit RPC6-like [Daphnia carinata]
MAPPVVIKKEKVDEPRPSSSADAGEGQTEAEIERRMLELMGEFPKGINDKILETDMPNVDKKVKVAILNRLLSQEKVNIFRAAVTKELFWCLKQQPTSKLKGVDSEEKIVMRIIEEAGNKGIWNRDIRTKSSLNQTTLNKILKALEGKKLIKSVSSVSAAKKKVYMLFNLQPDRSVTGGSWYSDNEFESELVDVLNQQCYRILQQKAEGAKQKPLEGPLVVRNASFLSSKEICQIISDLKIVKFNLTVEDIETILDTLVYDGKIEMSTTSDGYSDGQVKTYRTVEKLLSSAGIVRIPCGVCPVIKMCGTVGAVQPKTCVYYDQWLD